jgi:hypothetical protein
MMEDEQDPSTWKCTAASDTSALKSSGVVETKNRRKCLRGINLFKQGKSASERSSGAEIVGPLDYSKLASPSKRPHHTHVPGYLSSKIRLSLGEGGEEVDGSSLVG